MMLLGTAVDSIPGYSIAAVLSLLLAGIFKAYSATWGIASERRQERDDCVEELIEARKELEKSRAETWRLRRRNDQLFFELRRLNPTFKAENLPDD